MQIYVQDLFGINFSSSTGYDTVSTYDTNMVSLIINYSDTSSFCMHALHDTTYDTPIVSSLSEDTSFWGLETGDTSFWGFAMEDQTQISSH